MKKNITMFLAVLFGINVAYAAPKLNFLAGICLGSTFTYVACENQNIQRKYMPVIENQGLRKKTFDALKGATSFNLGLSVGVTTKGVACAVSGCGIDYKMETPQDAAKLVGFEAELKVSPLSGEFELVKPGKIRYS